jgi:hypothetical protein
VHLFVVIETKRSIDVYCVILFCLFVLRDINGDMLAVTMNSLLPHFLTRRFPEHVLLPKLRKHSIRSDISVYVGTWNCVPKVL